MAQYGPGDKPPVVRRRAARVRRRERAQRPPQTAAAAENQRQVATHKIRPNRATRPIVAPRAPAGAGDTKSDVSRGESFKQTRKYRGAVVGAYDSLSGHEKRQRVRQAASRVHKGTATEADRAVLHIH